MKKGFRKGLVFFAAFVYLLFGISELDACCGTLAPGLW
jgi:hypothetical protein